MKAEFSDRFCEKSINLLYSAAYKTIDFHKSITNTPRREKYAHNYIWVIKKLNKKWKKNELARPSVPTTFFNKIRSNKNLIFYKKRKNWQQTYTNRKAANADKAKQCQERWKNLIE